MNILLSSIKRINRSFNNKTIIKLTYKNNSVLTIKLKKCHLFIKNLINEDSLNILNDYKIKYLFENKFLIT